MFTKNKQFLVAVYCAFFVAISTIADGQIAKINANFTNNTNSVFYIVVGVKPTQDAQWPLGHGKVPIHPGKSRQIPISKGSYYMVCSSPIEGKFDGVWENLDVHYAQGKDSINIPIGTKEKDIPPSNSESQGKEIITQHVGTFYLFSEDLFGQRAYLVAAEMLDNQKTARAVRMVQAGDKGNYTFAWDVFKHGRSYPKTSVSWQGYC